MDRSMTLKNAWARRTIGIATRHRRALAFAHPTILGPRLRGNERSGAPLRRRNLPRRRLLVFLEPWHDLLRHDGQTVDRVGVGEEARLRHDEQIAEPAGIRDEIGDLLVALVGRAAD